MKIQITLCLALGCLIAVQALPTRNLDGKALLRREYDVLLHKLAERMGPNGGGGPGGNGGNGGNAAFAQNLRAILQALLEGQGELLERVSNIEQFLSIVMDEEEGEEEGSSEEGSSEEGSSEEGSSEEESSEEGSSEEGSTEEGSTEEGSSEEGSTEEGSTEEGSTEEGSAEEGSAEEGSTEEGSTGPESGVGPTRRREEEIAESANGEIRALERELLAKLKKELGRN